MPVRLVIFGEPASGKNSRDLVYVRDKATGARRPLFIKSKKARDYEAAVGKQIKPLPALLLGPLRFSARIFYASERPDLDESLILDALQGIIYKNDRQIRERHVWHGIDRDNPRAVIELEPVQADMVADPPTRRAT